MRRIETKTARAALTRAKRAAQEARIPALSAEVEHAAQILETPAARVIANGEDRLLPLEEVESLFASGAVVVDDCRRVVRQAGMPEPRVKRSLRESGAVTPLADGPERRSGTLDPRAKRQVRRSGTVSPLSRRPARGSGTVVPLATRPVLFAIARALAEAWPGDVSREVLVARAFGWSHVDESYRARLRVEIGRLRRELRPVATVSATKSGFALVPHHAREVVVLARPVEEEHADVLAFLADGEAWSSSGLALALGTSQRTAQRALDALESGGKVQSFGRGRARRWMAPTVPGFTTTLLLPAPLPGD
jgi:hypothetical protein